MKKWKLKRTVQCAKCPWKCSTNPFEIPDGYSLDKHKNLDSTISKEIDLDMSTPLKIMACHHSKGDNYQHCIGWVNNQLNQGNNIKLRIQMMSCENAGEITVKGKQYDSFEETIPKSCDL